MRSCLFFFFFDVIVACFAFSVACPAHCVIFSALSLSRCCLCSLARQVHPGIVRLMQGRETFDTSMDGMDMEVMKGFTWESIIAR